MTAKTTPEVAATRAGRQARIIALLSAREVHSQSELAVLLADEGIDVTQATLSRDLEELGAVKLRGADGGVGTYVVPEDGSPVRGVSGGTERLSRLLGELLVSTDASRVPRRTWRVRSTGLPCPTWWAPSPATTPSWWWPANP